MNQSNFNSLLIKYVIGFGSALLLSVASYLVVTGGWLPTPTGTMFVILILASCQLVIQLICFLHLGFSGRSRNRTVTILFTLAMMLVIVIGSLWIMQNLDYRMGMSGSDMNHYMQEQNKKGF